MPVYASLTLPCMTVHLQMTVSPGWSVVLTLYLNIVYAFVSLNVFSVA